ncbi:MAG TPA: tyrosine-type recombinase/integrase [Gemmatimonadaceae bacterium]|nr:tyrosine-type recombinase/integrase [Gemmatimonadaceae bacterium]
MTPARTGPRGAYRFEIDWTAKLGFRIDRSAETTSLREFNGLKAMLYDLRKDGQVEVLRRFASGEIPIATLKQAKKKGLLHSGQLLLELRLLEPLWHQPDRCPVRTNQAAAHTVECLGAVDRLLPRMATGTTRRRYETSLRKLARLAGAWLPATATVADLASVDWPALQAEWPGSGTDWMHLRRAVGRLLSVLLGHPHHPRRLEIVGQIPTADENERVPEITVAQFWALVEQLPDYAQPCLVVLAATGMRLGEYLRCRAEHLVPERRAIRVPGTKSKRATRVIEVGADAWPWIETGIPSPLGDKAIRRLFHEAAVATGHGRYAPVLDEQGEPLLKTEVELVKVPGQRRRERREVQVPKTRYEGLRLHDLRHVAGQVATDAGATLAQVGDALGHADPKTTSRYTRRLNAGVAGRAVTSALFQGRDQGRRAG